MRWKINGILFSILCLISGSGQVFAGSQGQDYVGVWLVSEKGGEFAEPPAKAVPPRFFDAADKENVFWEIAEANGRLIIRIPQRKLDFSNLEIAGRHVWGKTYTTTAEESDSARNQKTVELDITFSDYTFKGQLRFPGKEFAVEGRLPEGYINDKEELKRLRTDVKQAQEKNNKLIAQLASMQQENDALHIQVAALETKLQSVESALDKKSSKPLLISTEGLRFDHRLLTNTDLRNAPVLDAAKIATLIRGTMVALLAGKDSGDWSLVAAYDGVVGYVPSRELAPLSNAQPIVITYPKWDAGQEGKQMTVDAPGYLTLSGFLPDHAQFDAIEINGNSVPLKQDGTFSANLDVPSTGLAVSIVAEHGDRTERIDFVVHVK